MPLRSTWETAWGDGGGPLHARHSPRQRKERQSTDSYERGDEKGQPALSATKRHVVHLRVSGFGLPERHSHAEFGQSALR